MATIIRLADRRPEKPAPNRAATGGATILIFSGIRYCERRTDRRRRKTADAKGQMRPA